MIFLLTAFLIAFLLDFLFGDPHSALHPVALAGRLACTVEKICRKLSGDGIFSGMGGWFLMTAACCLPAYALTWGGGKLNVWFGAVIAGMWLYVCIALRSLIDHAEAIRRPLKSGDLTAARKALGMIVSRDTESLDESNIIRGAVESLSENVIDAVNSTLFWAALGYLAGGLPGLAAGAVFLRIANTLDACWGYRDERYEKFGKFAARADDFAHWIPARMTMFAIAFASLFCGGKLMQALETGFRHRKDHPSPNSCYGMASFAGALEIRLGGPTVYGGVAEPYPYWGDGRSVLVERDLVRAERLTVVSSLVFAIMILGGAWLWFAV